ncbi:carboxylesterase family protein [Actinospica sp. MGRD01-02]|uniref:Carboxylic ester hydrolase n=1 Tax=Actinospica acidithermotolerans TaxID=2828514 RepID=A0A941EC86_9ACTN|nr:carboxylesterase family protein [Actinospica acidithermotolerans]MBR7828871.1 carboxylesterase family protein [Actinospica acidithermotolerans]
MTTPSSPTLADPTEPEVRTTAGLVRGRSEDGLAVFRGIPFAEPPVGERRFAAPHPARAWNGVRPAYCFGPPCPQELPPGAQHSAAAFPEGDEWLTVNVWSPEPDPGARWPVMVGIHGGAYKLGYSGSPGYDARRIASAGNVVVVSLNYRLGVEGFARIEGAPANRGLLDQVAALTWVQENIAAFGGDPDQVTVFGESAGAGSIAALLAMPSARGLFHRAILQSVPGTFLSDELAVDVAAVIAAEAGTRPTAADLAAIDPLRLPDAGAAAAATMARHEHRWGIFARTITPFSPVVDGEILPTDPWQALSAGAGRDVDLIVGHTKDEYRLFIAMAGQLGKIGEQDAEAALEAFAPQPHGADAYRKAFPNATPGDLYELVQTDWLFRMPTLHLAEAQAAGGGRAHLYELTWATPGSGGIFGAPHGLDGPLLFGTFEAHLGPMLLGPEPTGQAVVLGERMRHAWTAFAATGDPGWPPYNADRRTTQVFDDEPVATAYPEDASRLIWQHHTFSALPLLTR